MTVVLGLGIFFFGILTGILIISCIVVASDSDDIVHDLLNKKLKEENDDEKINNETR